jgi:iron(II)-dependent oxidoreductase
MTSLEEILDSRQAALAGALAEATEYTDSLLAPLDDDQLMRQFTPLQSPLVWDIAHIAHYEELWLVRKITGGEATDERLDDVYDAFAHSRADRGGLRLLGPDDARAFRASVRERSLANLDRLEQAADERLALDAYAVGLVMQHELQHAETMCQTLQAASGLEYPLADGPDPATVSVGGEVLVTGGPFELGTSSDPWAYDNERAAHIVDLPAFCIDATAVTNAAYAGFIGDGGYREPRHWSEAGREWLRDERAEAPLTWLPSASGFLRRRFGQQETIPAHEPVQHVCYFEAEAYASWAGRRLPSEAEWEKAATWTPDGEKLVKPWGEEPHAGRANSGRVRFAPAPVGAYPAGVSPWGCHGMLGDVWEWTASPFAAYPGFSAFPYREYSEVFYGGDYRVLRGGSWATHPYVARATFRNWDHPQRRQIFSGFRTARDA